ncbi:unnamed protein product, partial [Allacma fusca]
MAPLFLQRRILRSEILLLVVILLILGCADSKPTDDFLVAKSGTREDGTKYAKTAIFEGKHPDGRMKILYAEVNHLDENETKSSADAGIIKHERMSIWGVGFSQTALSTGLEYNKGFMGRLTPYSASLHTGPVDIKASLNLDTGVSMHKGIETKIFGIGGKLTSDEFQICLF